MRMQKIKVEKRGTRYWVVIKEDEGFQKILYEAITKHECLHYLAKHKEFKI